MTEKKTGNRWSIFPYYGGKHLLALNIMLLTPEHTISSEVFGGSGVYTINKVKSELEFLNDKDDLLVNFHKVMADPSKFEKLHRLLMKTGYNNTVYTFLRRLHKAGEIHKYNETERAWIYFLLIAQAYSGKFAASFGWDEAGKREHAWYERVRNLRWFHNQLKNVVILDLDFYQAISDVATSATFFYCDPPYVHDTRQSVHDYRFEMSDADHQRFLCTIRKKKGKFLVSNYANPMYDNALLKFNRLEFDVPCPSSPTKKGEKKARRKEVMWFNYDVSPTKIEQLRHLIGGRINGKTFVVEKSGRNVADIKEVEALQAQLREAAQSEQETSAAEDENMEPMSVPAATRISVEQMIKRSNQSDDEYVDIESM